MKGAVIYILTGRSAMSGKHCDVFVHLSPFVLVNFYFFSFLNEILFSELSQICYSDSLILYRVLNSSLSFRSRNVFVINSLSNPTINMYIERHQAQPFHPTHQYNPVKPSTTLLFNPLTHPYNEITFRPPIQPIHHVTKSPIQLNPTQLNLTL